MNKYLELIRLPNVLTAAADSWTGFFLLCAVAEADPTLASPGVGILFCVVPLSCLLYAIGMILNNVVDFEHDKRHRPERPLPSGRISLNFAFGLAAVLLAAALLAAMLAGIERLIISFLLLACIVAYNSISKVSPAVSILPMGLCRALNIGLGIGAIALERPILLIGPIVLFLLTAGISIASLSEEKTERAKRAVKFGVLSLPAVDGLLLLTFGAYLPSLFCFAICAAAVTLSRRLRVA